VHLGEVMDDRFTFRLTLKVQHLSLNSMLGLPKKDSKAVKQLRKNQIAMSIFIYALTMVTGH
jgi:hypothetical protein